LFSPIITYKKSQKFHKYHINEKNQLQKEDKCSSVPGLLKSKRRHRKRWGQPCITHKSSSTNSESGEDVDELENQGESMKNDILLSISNGRRLSLQQPIDVVTQHSRKI
jgi:hypothetical protein